MTQTVVPAYTLQSADNSAALTVISGATATAQLTAVPAAGFTGTLSLSCTGLPAYASCTFTPATLNLAAAAQTFNLTVSTSASTAATLAHPQVRRRALMPISCSLLGGVIFLLWPRHRRIGGVLVLLVSIALLPIGCGGSNASPPSPVTGNTPAGTYPIQVVASSGAIQTSTSYTLTVQ